MDAFRYIFFIYKQLQADRWLHIFLNIFCDPHDLNGLNFEGIFFR